MNKIVVLISFLTLFFTLKMNASRALYVDGFDKILGNSNSENELLSFVKSHEIDVMLFYDLHVIHNTYDLTNAATNSILADFISRAKADFGVSSVGALGENSNFFTEIIHSYNNSRTNPLEKFDIYNLEFEFWNSSKIGSNCEYCENYLKPKGYPCTRTGAFQFYTSTLQSMNSLKKESLYPITVETYVGWFTKQEAEILVKNIDRLHLSAYAKDAKTTFSYSKSRLLDLVKSNADIDVSVIFSSESLFMNNWLSKNSMIEAERIFIKDWEKRTRRWEKHINLLGFTYFSYSNSKNVPLSQSQRKE